MKISHEQYILREENKIFIRSTKIRIYKDKIKFKIETVIKVI